MLQLPRGGGSSLKIWTFRDPVLRLPDADEDSLFDEGLGAEDEG